MKLGLLLRSLFRSAPRQTPAECAERVLRGEAILVDVREPGEWNTGVARTARTLALSDLLGERKQWKAFLAESAGRELLLYCAVGGRSGLAARVLVGEGVRAVNVGGLQHWAEAGWPIDQPRA